MTIPEDGGKFWDAIQDFARESVSLLRLVHLQIDLFRRIAAPAAPEDPR